MRFFVEETSFTLPSLPSVGALEKSLETFVALVEACRAKDEDIFCGPGLFEVEVAPGVALYQVLYESLPALKLDEITLKSDQLALSRCVDWDGRIDHLPDPNVSIEGTLTVAPTAAVVHARVASAVGAACLCLGLRTDRSGELAVGNGAQTSTVHFLTEKAKLPAFYRSLFEVENLDADAYMKNAAHAFPDIAFVPGLASQFSKFTGKYRDVRPKVTLHLGTLNDHFQRLFKENGYKPHETQGALGAHGIDASPESPKTRAISDAMKKRKIKVDTVRVENRDLIVGEVVTCEWHTKIEPTTNRIHFHPGVQIRSAGTTRPEERLMVGIFADHLPI